MTAGSEEARTPTSYTERLTPPWWVWIVGCCLPLPLAIAYGSAYGTLVGLATGSATTVVVVAGLLITAPTIAVTPVGIRAGRALLPFDAVGGVEALSARELLDQRRSPRAYLTVRTWSAATGVTVEVVDPTDPHDRWVLTSRRPEAFAAAIERHRPHRPPLVPSTGD